MKRLKRALWWLVVISGVSNFLITLTPLTEWLGEGLTVPWQEASGETLVVLSGSLYFYPGLRPIAGENTHLRSLEAVALWSEHHYPRILVVGNSGASQLMKGFLVAHGVPAMVVEEEPYSGNTRENAVAVRNWLEKTGRSTKNLVLLTSDIHTYRARASFQKTGLAVKTVRAPDVLKRSLHWQERWSCFWEICREASAIAYYRWKGWA